MRSLAVSLIRGILFLPSRSLVHKSQLAILNNRWSFSCHSPRYTSNLATMGSQFDAASESTPFKVLVLGGCYGGLSAALNLLDLSEGRAARQGNGAVPGHDGKIPVDITIVDERDGYCMFEYLTTSVSEHSDREQFKCKPWFISNNLGSAFTGVSRYSLYSVSYSLVNLDSEKLQTTDPPLRNFY